MYIRKYVIGVVLMATLTGCSSTDENFLESQIEEQNKLIQELNNEINTLNATNKEVEDMNVSLV